MALQELMGRCRIDGSRNAIKIGGDDIVLTQGNYYFAGYDATDTQLCEHLEDKIVDAGWAGATVTYSLSTGRCTIALGASGAIAFTSSQLAAIFGFTGDQTAAETHVGTQTPRFNWRPATALAQMPGNASNIFVPRSNTTGGRAPDGTTYGSVGSILYDAKLAWELLAESLVLKPSGGTVGDDLESWFEDVPHNDQPFRLIVDRDSYSATTDFVVCKWGEDGQESLGGFEEYVDRERDDYQGLWNITIPTFKHLTA